MDSMKWAVGYGEIKENIFHLMAPSPFQMVTTASTARG